MTEEVNHLTIIALTGIHNAWVQLDLYRKRVMGFEPTTFTLAT